jgi:DNA-directed RNA polymerase omega subunit
MTNSATEEHIGTKYNRFKLVILIGQRAKDLNAGAKKLVTCSNKDKYPVIAIREIEEKKLDLEDLEIAAIKNCYPCSIDSPTEEEDKLIQEIEKAFGQESDKPAIIDSTTENLEQEESILKEEKEEIEEDLEYIDYENISSSDGE